MKRRLYTLLALLLAFATLAACAEQKPDVIPDDAIPDASAEPPQSEQPAELDGDPKAEVHILLDRIIPQEDESGSTSTATTGRIQYGELAAEIVKIAEKYNDEENGNVVVDTFLQVKRATIGSYSVDSDSAYIDVMANDPAYKEYRRLQASGDEPDIVLFAPGADLSHPYLDRSSPYIEYYKYVKNGDLADLKPFMDDDPEYERSDYVEAVMDGGIHGSEQLFIPFLYQSSTYAGLVEKAEMTGAPHPGSFTSFDDFWTQIKKMSDYAEGAGIPPFAGAYISDYSDRSIYTTDNPPLPMLYSGDSLFDIASGTIYRGDHAFETIVKTSFEIDNLYEEHERASDNFINSPYNHYGEILEDRACLGMWQVNTFTHHYFHQTFDPVSYSEEGVAEYTTYIAPAPSVYDHENGTAQIMFAMGVSESSDNKRAAYEFIMYCLRDDEFCKSLCNFITGNYYSVPMSREHLEAYLYQEEFQNGLFDAGSERVMRDGAKYIDAVTSVANAVPYYQPLNRSFIHHFNELYKTGDRSAPELLLADLYDRIDADMTIHMSH